MLAVTYIFIFSHTILKFIRNKIVALYIIIYMCFFDKID